VSEVRGAPLRIDRHPRLYRENRYVYPVLSRRAHGISIGINLNPDKICNFDCIYCQVDREVPPVVKDVDETRLQDELRDTLRQAKSGALFERDEFKSLPPAGREIRDVTFAGDGEPPSYPNFTGVVRETIRIKKEEGFEKVPINLLTNATLIDRPRVQEGMRLIDADGGAHWLKLDAGTEAYYQLVERTTIPFARVLANITAAARERPVVIQSLFMRIRGDAPSPAEIEAWCGRLETILKEGGAIRLVQVYTVARPPAESYVTPLSDQEVDAIASEARRRLPGIAVESFYSGRF
jgi:wyosine [tRNA(Phe)-imidazoG37] synthetase (radical SAM superfamily)